MEGVESVHMRTSEAHLTGSYKQILLGPDQEEATVLVLPELLL